MTQYLRVWAPLPKKVELDLGGKRIPMSRDDQGWWTATAAPVNLGADYGFILDGVGPLPDPRSPWQSRGIDGPSRRVDHAAFRWTDANWKASPLSEAIIYELHVGTFTDQGTFDAAIAKLDHLVQLGITHVELMPVNEFSGTRGWGYDGVMLYAPHHAYGGPDGLKRLVDACHARKLAVILDVVYNHLGPAGNHLAKYGPYFTHHHTSPWGEALNFDDADSTEVRRFFCDNALMWLREYHFDGLRLDAVHAIIDTSAVPFLEQLTAEVRQLESELGRPLAVIAESDLNDPRLLWPIERGGFGMNAQWNDDFHHALHTVLTGEKDAYYADFGSLSHLDIALRQAFVYAGRFSNFRRRGHGRAPTGLNGSHFLGYMQNHDQVGNRAKGERSSQIMSPGRLKIAAALVLTSPFVPMLFQGEEWGAATPFFYFTAHEDAKLAEAVSEGRRREFSVFGWKSEEIPDPQSSETFARSKLNWSELTKTDHSNLLDWHRKLIALRRSEPSLRDGRLDLVRNRLDEHEHWFLMERGNIIVACNLSDTPKSIPLPSGQHQILLASAPLTSPETLPPESVVILKKPSVN